MSKNSVILLEDISSSKPDTESVVDVTISDAADPLFPLMPLKRKLFGEGGKESPVGSPEQTVEKSDVCETKAGTEVDVEDEDVDVVGGVADVGVSRYESEGFTLSEILCRRRLSIRTVAHASHLPQCKFSNLQKSH